MRAWALFCHVIGNVMVSRRMSILGVDCRPENFCFNKSTLALLALLYTFKEFISLCHSVGLDKKTSKSSAYANSFVGAASGNIAELPATVLYGGSGTGWIGTPDSALFFRRLRSKGSKAMLNISGDSASPCRKPRRWVKELPRYPLIDTWTFVEKTIC